MIPLDTIEKTYLIPSLLPMLSEPVELVKFPETKANVHESCYKLPGPNKITLDAYHKLMCRLGNEAGWKIQQEKLFYMHANLTTTEGIM